MHLDAAMDVLADKPAMVTILLRSVLALPLENIRRQKVVTVLKCIRHVAFVQRAQEAKILRL